eukprot:1118586-Pleurochrysis_carterae.AAC.3
MWLCVPSSLLTYPFFLLRASSSPPSDQSVLGWVLAYQWMAVGTACPPAVLAQRALPPCTKVRQTRSRYCIYHDAQTHTHTVSERVSE